MYNEQKLQKGRTDWLLIQAEEGAEAGGKRVAKKGTKRLHCIDSNVLCLDCSKENAKIVILCYNFVRYYY